MTGHLVEPDVFAELAPAGYYIALRLGFAFPQAELNALPADWIDHYTRNRFMLDDPVIRWVYDRTGWVRWSEIAAEDSRGIFASARDFGLCYGVAVCVTDDDGAAHRSFGSFARSDREYDEDEVARLTDALVALLQDRAPPTTLTEAEIEALRMVREGLRLKQIAHELGVTEGAVKQRLRNARTKLGAKTGSEAVSLAVGFRLI